MREEKPLQAKGTARQCLQHHLIEKQYKHDRKTVCVSEYFFTGYKPVILIHFSFHDYRPNTYFRIPINAEHTDPPVDVEQNVA